MTHCNLFAFVFQLVLPKHQIRREQDKMFYGKTGVPGGKPLGAEKRTDKRSTHMASSARIKPRPHWWKASAPTTAPTLLP